MRGSATRSRRGPGTIGAVAILLLAAGCSTGGPADPEPSGTDDRAVSTSEPSETDDQAVSTAEPSPSGPVRAVDLGTLDGALREQTQWVLDHLAPGASGPAASEVEERFHPDFLAEVPADRQDEEVAALMEQVKAAFGEYAQQNKNLRLDSFHLENLRSMKEPGSLADVVTKYATWEVADKQASLEEPSALKRLELVYGFLTRDLEWFDTEKQISARVKQQMDSNQREYFLREQMKAIQRELGNDEGSESEELRAKIEEKDMPEHAKERALKEVDRLEKMAGGSPEATVVRTYLDTLIDLPWSEIDEEHLDVKHSQEVLDEGDARAAAGQRHGPVGGGDVRHRRRDLGAAAPEAQRSLGAVQHDAASLAAVQADPGHLGYAAGHLSARPGA